MPTGKVNERNAHVKVRYLEKNSDIKEVQQLEWEYNWNENTMPLILKRFIPIQLFHNWYKLVEGSCVHTNLILKPVTYSHQLGDRYTGLGGQTLAPKKHFSSLLFQSYFHKKYVGLAMTSECIQLFRNGLQDKNAEEKNKKR